MFSSRACFVVGVQPLTILFSSLPHIVFPVAMPWRQPCSMASWLPMPCGTPPVALPDTGSSRGWCPDRAGGLQPHLLGGALPERCAWRHGRRRGLANNMPHGSQYSAPQSPEACSLDGSLNTLLVMTSKSSIRVKPLRRSPETWSDKRADT
jgi:hypothetical protein